jgi:Fe-S cluster assembly protein SufD
MATTALNETLLEEVNALAKQNNAVWNQDAYNQFIELGFPTIKHEEWKYTNLKNALSRNYNLSSKSSITAEEVSSITNGLPNGHYLIFVNGIFSPSLSTFKEEGYKIALFSDETKLVDTYFGKNLPYVDSMTQLNIAFAQNGLVIKALKGKKVEPIINCVFITDARNEGVFAQPSLLMIAEEASDIGIVEHSITLGNNPSFNNIFTHSILKKDAFIDYVKIQNDASHTVQVNNAQTVHEAACNSFLTTISLNGELVRNNANINLAASHNEAHLFGLFLLKGTTHVDNHTLVDHAMPNCFSNELYKGIVDDKAKGIFNGKIWVRKDAQKTNAFQSNKNILLSNDASVNTKPQLEIFADDVKCSHGTTTGQLNPESLFYLRARGVGEDKAKRMLVQAFAFDVLDNIRHEAIRTYLETIIEERLVY